MRILAVDRIPQALVIAGLLLLDLGAANAAIPTARITIDTQTRYQTIDGFGVSQAFQRARQILPQNNSTLLSPEQSTQVLDLLFSSTHGAGLSILRNGIGSSPSYALDWMKSILPSSPGTPGSTPNYEWDGDDAGQVWLTKEAQKRGVATVYADAWSAPGYMKTNGQDANGGYICGVSGAECESGDWREAYAEYLVQFLRFYKEREGIEVKYLGFLNEPDLNQTYASMQSSGFQAGDFLPILRGKLAKSEFRGVRIVCCEATGWTTGAAILAELQSVPGAEDALHVYAAHGYSTPPAFRLDTTKPVWQTEWADLNGRWNTAWDNLGKDGEGISWANKIQNALTLSNVSAFFYWIGAERGPNNSPLIRVQNGTVEASKRLWAFGHFGRFVKPGAVRVEARCDVGYVSISAFENVDGGIALVLVNNGHLDVHMEVKIGGLRGNGSSVTPWVTDNLNELTQLESIPVVGGDDKGVGFAATVLKRSMVSFVVK